MKQKQTPTLLLAGICAGTVTGLLGAGGGMVLVPLLTALTDLKGTQVFFCSVAIMLPVCVVSLLVSGGPFPDIGISLPYLLGSLAGGLLSAKLGRKIPVKWLHRALGVLILWGGIRNLC